MAAGITTLLGADSTFEGSLTFDSPVRIDGRYRGVIRSSSTLVLGENADVDARIAVDTVIIRGGTLRGRIVAKQAIEVYAPAQIFGDLHSPSVFLDKGVSIQGLCKMDAVHERDIRELLSDEPASSAKALPETTPQEPE